MVRIPDDRPISPPSGTEPAAAPPSPPPPSGDTASAPPPADTLAPSTTSPRLSLETPPLQLEAPSLRRTSTNPFGLSYRTGEINRPLTRTPGMTHAVTRPSYTSVFTDSERADMDRVNSSGTRTAEDYQRISGYLDTPEKVAAYLGQHFNWRDTHDSALETYSPLSIFQSGEGVCRDQHNFAARVLQENGFVAHNVGYGSPGVHHAITTFQNPDGTWGVIEYGRVHQTGMRSEAEALSRVMPGAFKFWVYDDASSPTDSGGIPTRTLWTHAGRELVRFMHADDAHLPESLSALRPGGPLSFGDRPWGGLLNTDDTGSTARLSRGRWDVDLRAWHDQDPMLSSAFGGAVRFHLDDRQTLSAGLVHLPEAYSYSVGPRTREESPTTLAFVGADGNWDLWSPSLTDDGRLRFNSNLDARVGLGVAFNGAGIDTGPTSALSHADLTWRNELSWQATSGLRLWAAETAYLPLGDVGSYLLTGGDLSGAPVSAYGELGADLTSGRLAASGSVYVPQLVRTNLFAEDPRWQAALGYRLGDRTQLVAGVEGDFDGDPFRAAYAGVQHGALTLSGGVRQDSFAGGQDGYVQLSVDVGRLFRRGSR